jgi:hypothetical protein
VIYSQTGKTATWPGRGRRPSASHSERRCWRYYIESHMEKHESEISGAPPDANNYGSGVRWERWTTGCSQCTTLITVSFLAIKLLGVELSADL